MFLEIQVAFSFFNSDNAFSDSLYSLTESHCSADGDNLANDLIALHVAS